MAIKFKPIPKKNPQDRTAPAKFYAQAIADGEIDLDGLAVQIEKQSTVSEADIYAVLRAAVPLIIQNLTEGKIVRLGTLGDFQVGISSEGKATEEEVNAASIKSSKIKFRAGKRLKDGLKTATFKKA